MPMGTVSEVWNINWSDLYPRFEIKNWSEQMDDIWQVQTSESNSMHESSGSRESNVFVCDSVYVYRGSCKDVIMTMWCMRWIMKAYFLVVWLR